ASSANRVVAAKASTTSAMSSSSISWGTSLFCAQGRGDGAHSGSRLPALVICRPAWRIWTRTAAPSAWTASAMRRRPATLRGAKAFMEPEEKEEVGWTRRASTTISPMPPPGALGVVPDVPLARQVALGEAGAVGGVHEPVAQRHRAQPEGGEEVGIGLLAH